MKKIELPLTVETRMRILSPTESTDFLYYTVRLIDNSSDTTLDGTLLISLEELTALIKQLPRLEKLLPLT